MTLPANLSPRVAQLLEKTRAPRARMILAIDATASRENTWDLATSLTASMAEEAAKVGSLAVQLIPTAVTRSSGPHGAQTPTSWLAGCARSDA